jgi:hypothetical protein
VTTLGTKFNIADNWSARLPIARELDQFAQAYEQMAAQPRNTLESAIASLILNDAFWSYPDDISTADAISRMREAIAQL